MNTETTVLSIDGAHETLLKGDEPDGPCACCVTAFGYNEQQLCAGCGGWIDLCGDDPEETAIHLQGRHWHKGCAR